MIIVGHRGARQEAPENTVNGFIHAQQHGCQHFELDIQLSKDHELMVFHDDTLLRTTGFRGKLSRYNQYDLSNMDARCNTPGFAVPCYIPTLQEVVDCAPHTQHWQFEVKSDSRQRLSIVVRKLINFISHNKLNDRVTVTSSNRWFLARMREASQLSLGYVAEWPLPRPVMTAQKLGCHYLCINQSLVEVEAETVTNAKALGMHVSVWTVNDKERMRQLEQLGVDSIITDLPSSALTWFS